MKREYKTLTVEGREHVICTAKNRGPGLPDANYMGTGMALCGVLPKGESIDYWMNE